MNDDMPLWIYDSGCNTEAIETGVQAAKDSLASAGVTAEAAHSASLSRAAGESYDAAAADAWVNAEIAALNASGSGETGVLAAA